MELSGEPSEVHMGPLRTILQLLVHLKLFPKKKKKHFKKCNSAASCQFAALLLLPPPQHSGPFGLLLMRIQGGCC